MQCCESHGKGARKSAPKKAKYYGGVVVTNRIASRHQANCTHSEMDKTLKAEEIPISLSAIKRIGQHFETTVNVARNKGFGMPKASPCRDDHLRKCTVLKDRKRSLQKLSAESVFWGLDKTLSRRTITRRLSNAGFVSIRCFKKPLLSEKHERQNLVFGRIWTVWFRVVQQSCVEWWIKISVACSREVCSKIWWMFRLCLIWIQSAFLVSSGYCLLTHRLCRTPSLHWTPPSLFIPICINTSVCALSICQNVDHLSVPSYLYTSYLIFCEQHPLLWFTTFASSSGFVCPSAFCLWLLICFSLPWFLPAPWYLLHSDFWFWLLLVFRIVCCYLTLYHKSLFTWLLTSASIKTFSAFSLVCIWFLIRV